MDDIGNAGEYNGGHGSPYFLSGLRLLHNCEKHLSAFGGKVAPSFIGWAAGRLDIMAKLKGEKVFLKLLNGKLWTIWFFLLFLTISALYSHAAAIESKRLRVKHNIECYIPYASNLPIDKEDANITHLIIAVYSSGSNVFNSCIELLAKYNQQQDNVIVLSPQFLTKEQLGNNSEENLLYWNAQPFYGSKISTTKSFDGDLRISAYHIVLVQRELNKSLLQSGSMG